MGTHEQRSVTRGEITLRYTATLSTDGAAPTAAGLTRSDGFGVLVSSGSGVYTIPLVRGAPELLEFKVECKQASYSVDGACYGDETTDNVAGASPSITFTMRDADGVAVQPATGDKIKIKAVVRR
jgi:hypothetical protein